MKGPSPSDWNVTLAGDEGTIRSAEYRGRFVVSRIGVVKIIWQRGPGPKDAGRVNMAAKEAIEAALRR